MTKELKDFLYNKVSNRIKNFLELKSQFQEIDSKVIVEIEKQKKNSSRKKDSGQKDRDSTNKMTFSSFFDGETEEETKFQCSESVIQKQDNTMNYTINNTISKASELLKDDRKNVHFQTHKSIDYTFTCYNQFTNQIKEIKEIKESTNYSKKHSYFPQENSIEGSDGIDKINEKFMLSLKNSKLETLLSLTKRTTIEEDDHLRASEFTNPYYVEECEFDYEKNIIFREKRNQDDVKKIVQYISVNLLIKVLLCRDDYLSIQMNQDIDLNMITLFFFQHNKSFIDSIVILSKVNSLYSISSVKKSNILF